MAKKRPTRPTRQQKTKLLMMCEGETEVLLFKHIKSLFPCSIDVKNAHGKGASNVVNSAIRLSGYDTKYVLIDADENTLPTALQNARKNDIEVIQLEPCSEGVFLKVLGDAYPQSAPSAVLKRQLQTKISDSEPYCALYTLNQFKKEVLMQCHEPAIKDLIAACNKHKNPNR